MLGSAQRYLKQLDSRLPNKTLQEDMIHGCYMQRWQCLQML
jgi:hypothetical protein